MAFVVVEFTPVKFWRVEEPVRRALIVVTRPELVTLKIVLVAKAAVDEEMTKARLLVVEAVGVRARVREA